MLTLGSFFCALIITYFTRRLIARVVKVNGAAGVLVANGASFVLWGTFAGFVKAYVSVFAYSAVIVYAVAQIVWVAVDLAHLQGERRLR